MSAILVRFAMTRHISHFGINDKQEVKVIWQKYRITAAHRPLNRIRQVAAMCTPI